MKAGDVVRFTKRPRLRDVTGAHTPDWKLGLLIEYNSWEKIARILYEGKMISIRAEYVQLAWRNPEEI
jgi:hypothetical protein